MKALKAHKIPFRPELIENGNFDETLGYEAVKRLFAKNIPFTAIYAANDEMALGVYKACKEFNVVIPTQLALVGVDLDFANTIWVRKLPKFLPSSNALLSRKNLGL